MEFQCHPELSRAKTDEELQAEQDEFILSGSISSTKLISNNEGDVRKVVLPSIPVLQEVVERDEISAIRPPAAKPPLKPFKLAPNKKSSDISVLKSEISHENDEMLKKLSPEELEALRAEVFENVPESFLEKLRK